MKIQAVYACWYALAVDNVKAMIKPQPLWP